MQAGLLSADDIAEVISYNYSVRYDADDVQQHWLKEARYVGNAVASAENDWHGMDAHPPGSWAVFFTGVLPRAPQAGRTADLRAAPLELVALGGASSHAPPVMYSTPMANPAGRTLNFLKIAPALRAGRLLVS